MSKERHAGGGVPIDSHGRWSSRPARERLSQRVLPTVLAVVHGTSDSGRALLPRPRGPFTPVAMTDAQPMSPDQITQSKKQQQAISRAFEGACKELGIGLLSLDAWKRERLAQLILSFAEKGVFDAAALQRDAVTQYKNAGDESSSTA